MNEQFKATSFLFDKIKRLYPTFVRPDELDIEVWTEILDGYSQTEILDALKAYRKNTPYDKAPNPATFKAFLGQKEYTGGERNGFKAISPAEQLMEADIASGNCRHLLNVYQLAVNQIMTSGLLEVVPAEEYHKMNTFERYQTAKNNGLFDNFSETLKSVCLKYYGKENQFQSENELRNAKAHRFSVSEPISTLASHWGLD